MTAINILLGIVAGILFFGVVGETDRQKHKNIMISFVSILLFIIAVNYML